MELLLDVQKSTYNSHYLPFSILIPLEYYAIITIYHQRRKHHQSSTVSEHTHTCTRASCCGEFIILSPLTCYVFLLSLNNAWKPVVHLEAAPGLFGFTSTCGGAPHVIHVCSRSFPPSLHNYDTYNLKSFLRPTLRGRPSAPTFTLLTFILFLSWVFFWECPGLWAGLFLPCVL